MLPSGWYVALPMTLARALGYLNHKYQLPALHQISRCSVVQLIEDQSLTLLATTTTLSRKEQFFGGILSLVNAQASVFRIVVEWVNQAI